MTAVINLLHFITFLSGLHKKLQALAKQKECRLVGEWEKSIINHLYWCVASSPTSQKDLIKAKWLSLVNHIHNIHTSHDDMFPTCAHGPIEETDLKKKWFKSRKSCKLYVT